MPQMEPEVGALPDATAAADARVRTFVPPRASLVELCVIHSPAALRGVPVEASGPPVAAQRRAEGRGA